MTDEISSLVSELDAHVAKQALLIQRVLYCRQVNAIVNKVFLSCMRTVTAGLVTSKHIQALFNLNSLPSE